MFETIIYTLLNFHTIVVFSCSFLYSQRFRKIIKISKLKQIKYSLVKKTYVWNTGVDS